MHLDTDYVCHRLTAPTLQAERDNASWFPAPRAAREIRMQFNPVHHRPDSDSFAEVS